MSKNNGNDGGPASGDSSSSPAQRLGVRPAVSGRPSGAGALRRRAGAGGASQQGARGGGAPPSQGLGARETLRFYTDDAPGLRIGPTMVLLFSVIFIGSVVLLHIYGKMMYGGSH